MGASWLVTFGGYCGYWMAKVGFCVLGNIRQRKGVWLSMIIFMAATNPFGIITEFLRFPMNCYQLLGSFGILSGCL